MVAPFLVRVNRDGRGHARAQAPVVAVELDLHADPDARADVLGQSRVRSCSKRSAGVSPAERLGEDIVEVVDELHRAGTQVVEGKEAGSLEHCTETLVEQLAGSFARIWTVDASRDTLVLQANAGLPRDLEGAHSRVPLGATTIGPIAANTRAHIMNDGARRRARRALRLLLRRQPRRPTGLVGDANRHPARRESRQDPGGDRRGLRRAGDVGRRAVNACCSAC